MIDDYYGIQLYNSTNSTIYGNNAYNNYHDGFRLELSSDNYIFDNIFSHNAEYGMHVGGLGNTFWNNSIINNPINAYDTSNDNAWNLSNVGNYWSDFINNI